MKRSAFTTAFRLLLHCLIACALVVISDAQNAGNNAVYNSAGISNSSATIDASVFAKNSTTFCLTIFGILTGATGFPPYPATGAIIDARGMNANNSNLTCGSTESPWYHSGVYANKPSVILLPTGTITISYTWQLPNQTRIIGQGARLPGQTDGTQLEASGSFVGLGNIGIPTAMIQFGDTASLTCGVGVCFNISVQDLTLNGANQFSAGSSIDGIINLDSQELSYVRRVNIYHVTGTGLQVGNPQNPRQPQNSGPYEDIYYTAGTSGTPLPVCAQIYSTGPVRGIHGITCKGNGSTQIAGGAILLDAFANSVTDVYVDGFQDGILIGSQINGTPSAPGTGSANVVRNVRGSSNVTNLIHICNPSSAQLHCNSSATNPAVTDVTLMGITSAGTYSIVDDMTGAHLTDPNVGMYVLGESITGGISRFTTSRSVPTWFVGSGNASGLSCSGIINGSLYSSTATVATGGPLWVCAGGTWTQVN